jgi:predicted HicB family RNase H-like nuclease
MFVVKNEQNESITKTIRLPKDIYERLNSIAKKNKITLNNIIIQACRYAVNEYKEEELKK